MTELILLKLDSPLDWLADHPMHWSPESGLSQHLLLLNASKTPLLDLKWHQTLAILLRRALSRLSDSHSLSRSRWLPLFGLRAINPKSRFMSLRRRRANLLLRNSSLLLQWMPLKYWWHLRKLDVSQSSRKAEGHVNLNSKFRLKRGFRHCYDQLKHETGLKCRRDSMGAEWRRNACKALQVRESKSRHESKNIERALKRYKEDLKKRNGMPALNLLSYFDEMASEWNYIENQSHLSAMAFSS